MVGSYSSTEDDQSALFCALMVILTRKLQSHDSSATMAYYSSLIYLAAALVLVLLPTVVGEVPDALPGIGLLQPFLREETAAEAYVRGQEVALERGGQSERPTKESLPIALDKQFRWRYLNCMHTKTKNPYQRALITISGLMGFSVLISAFSLGLSAIKWISPAWTWASLIAAGIMVLLWGSIWILGAIQNWRAAAFLASERPLIRWTYTPGEWQQFKQQNWQEERADWKVQWGCLTGLLALSGLLAGVLIGLEQGALPALGNGLLGALIGGLAGFVIGALVAGGNYWGAWQAYRDMDPGQVALGVGEIYANGAYFKAARGKRFIRKAQIRPGRPAVLEFELVFPPRPRMPLEEQWLIPVPARSMEQLEADLPAIASNPPHQTNTL